MLRFWLASTTAVAMIVGVAAAQTSTTAVPIAPQPPGAAEPIMTIAPPTSLHPTSVNGGPSESAVATGRATSAAPTTAGGGDILHLPIYTENPDATATSAFPGSGIQGVSTDSGNATGTIVP